MFSFAQLQVCFLRQKESLENFPGYIDWFNFQEVISLAFFPLSYFMVLYIFCRLTEAILEKRFGWFWSKELTPVVYFFKV